MKDYGKPKEIPPVEVKCGRMKEHLTGGGWEWYLRQLKEKLERSLTPEEIHMIMQEHYIKGYSPEKALEELK